MRVNLIIWSLQITMICSFLVFSFFPFLWLIINSSLTYLSLYLSLLLISTVVLVLLGLISVIGIITLKLEYRPFVTIFFSSGILFYLRNPYLLALGVILAFSFYNFWFIAFKYHQLDQEYSSYPPYSIERQKLLKTFQIQLSSFILLAWIVLSISWGILFFASNFYIELGTGEFGTSGITISIAITLLFFLVQKYYSSYS